MKKCPVASSLYYYNKSKKAYKSSEKQFCSTEHEVKDAAIEASAKKNFIYAYFDSKKNK